MACVLGDANFSSVVLLCHFNGANGGTSTVDSSSFARTVTQVGSQCALSTAHAAFGATSSTTGSTTGNRWACADSSDWQFSGAFVVECSIYLTQTPGANKIVAQAGANGNESWYFGFNDATHLTFKYSTSGAWPMSEVAGAWTPSLNAWHAVCAERDASNALRVYADGAVIAGPTTVSGTFFNSTATLQIAGDDGNLFNSFTSGFLDELRITKGVSRYGGTYTPAVAAFPDTALNAGCAKGSFHSPFGERVGFPSPTLLAALAPLVLGRAIERNRVTTRRGLLRP